MPKSSAIQRGRVRSTVGHPNLILETLPEVCKELGWVFASRPGKLNMYNEWDGIHARVEGKGFYSSFALQQMPGCCAVLTASYIDPEPYKPDEFRKVVQAIAEATRRAGFGSLILTQVIKMNIPLNKHVWFSIMGDGFEMSEPFINAKSGNSVVYLTKDLEQDGKIAGMEVRY